MKKKKNRKFVQKIFLDIREYFEIPVLRYRRVNYIPVTVSCKCASSHIKSDVLGKKKVNSVIFLTDCTTNVAYIRSTLSTRTLTIQFQHVIG